MVRKARAARRANESRRQAVAEKQAPMPPLEQVRRAAANAATRRDRHWQAELAKAAQRARWLGKSITVAEYHGYADQRVAIVDAGGTVRDKAKGAM